MTLNRLPFVCLLALAVACGGPKTSSDTDGGTAADAGHVVDAGHEEDAGHVEPDGGHEEDAGHVEPDGGHEEDAGPVESDGGHEGDAGPVAPDGGHEEDAGPSDAGVTVTHQISVSGDGHVEITPSGTVDVVDGATRTFVVAPGLHYALSQLVGGNCPGGSWVGGEYTTGPITADCSITFSATIITYAVTVGGDDVVTSPSDVQTVVVGQTVTYIVNPTEGRYVLKGDGDVGGNCPHGSWDGDTYTTGAISGDCTVTFASAPFTFEVTPTGDDGVVWDPATAQTIDYGQTATFEVTLKPGYEAVRFTGNCPAGTLNGTTYTTGPITEHCLVGVETALKTFNVSINGDDGWLPTPGGTEAVAYGQQQVYRPSTRWGYHLKEPVEYLGTCPFGEFYTEPGSPLLYRTGAITEDCTVGFATERNTYEVTALGDHVTIAPAASQTITHGDPASFTVTADVGYTLTTSTVGNCQPGAWDGNTYTTGLITETCAITFSATQNTYGVAVSGDGSVSILLTSDVDLVNVPHGTQLAFTVTPVEHYRTVQQVGGTCPAGSWNGNDYVSGEIMESCSISFSGELAPASVKVLNVPEDSSAGTCLTAPPVQLIVYDWEHNVLTTPNVANVILTDRVNEPLSFSIPFVDGVATLDGDHTICFTHAANYVLRVYFDTLLVDTQVPVSPGAPTRVAFHTQPTGGLAGGVLPSFQAVVMDDYGDTVVEPAELTVSLLNDNGATLMGTTTVSVGLDGIATFDNLAVDLPGTYTLALSGSDGVNVLAGAESDSFTVTESFALTVYLAGLGKGAVAIDGETICTTDDSPCGFVVAAGAGLSFTGESDGGDFVGWRGDCQLDGSGTCAIEASGDIAITAGFAAPYFWSYDNSFSAVYGASLTGGARTQLFAPGFPYATPDYIISGSSDGLTFAYVSNADPAGGPGTTSISSVFLIDLWAGETRVIAPEGAWWNGIAAESLSPDAQHVAFLAGAPGYELQVATTDGSAPVTLTSSYAYSDCAYNSCANTRFATWSSDSSLVTWISDDRTADDTAATVYPNVWIATANGADTLRVTNFTSDTIEADPLLSGAVFSPDVTHIAFLSREMPNGDGGPSGIMGNGMNIWIVDANSQRQAVTNFGLNQNLDIPIWPVDDTIVFSSHSDPFLVAPNDPIDSRNIFAVSPDGSNYRALTVDQADGFYNGAPTWYAPGHALVFESNHDPLVFGQTLGAWHFGIWTMGLESGVMPTVVDASADTWDYMPIDNND